MSEFKGASLSGGNRALGRTMALPLRGQLPRPRSHDDRTRRRGRPLHDLSLVQRFAPEMEKRLRWQWRRPQSTSWRIDETYVKVRGKWAYLYRALDKLGNTIDFYLSATRNTKAAKRFLGKALRGLKKWEQPEVLNTDKVQDVGWPDALRGAPPRAHPVCAAEAVRARTRGCTLPAGARGHAGRGGWEGTDWMTVARFAAMPVPCIPAPEPRRSTQLLVSNIPPFPSRQRPDARSLPIQKGAAVLPFKPLPNGSCSPGRVFLPGGLMQGRHDPHPPARWPNRSRCPAPAVCRIRSRATDNRRDVDAPDRRTHARGIVHRA